MFAQTPPRPVEMNIDPVRLIAIFVVKPSLRAFLLLIKSLEKSC